jgi:hypothetical protein
MIPVLICGVWRGEFLLNTFTPISSVSASTATILEAFQCFGSHADRGYLLQGLTIGGERLPDLRVRVSRAATLLDVDGMLGLNFLQQFATVRFDVDGGMLTLERRS